MNNKTRICAVAAAAVLTATAGCTAGGGGAGGALNVAVYGGVYGDGIEKCILAPFTKETGTPIVKKIGVGSATVATLMQQKAQPQMDAAWIDGGMSEEAASQGLLADIDPATIPNMGDIDPKGVYKGDSGGIYAMSTGYYGFGIIYDKTKVPTAPTSWDDILDGKYAGKVSAPQPSNAMGLPFLLHLAKLKGGGTDNVAPGAQAIKSMKASAFFPTAGTSENYMSSGETVIQAGYAASAFGLTAKGMQVGYVVPKEGGLAGDIRVHQVKGAPNAKGAQQLTAYAMRADAQACLAKELLVGPPNKTVQLDPELKAKMPWGEKGTLADLNVPDWKQINAKRGEWSAEFDKATR